MKGRTQRVAKDDGRILDGTGHKELGFDFNGKGCADKLLRAAETCFLRSLPDEGVEMLHKALVVSERVYGSEDDRTIRICHRLGQVQMELGHLEAAEPLYRRVLTWCVQHRGADHEEASRASQSLAAVLFHQGKLAEASDLQARAVEICLSHHGEQDPHTLEAVKLFVLCEAHAERERLKRGRQPAQG